MTQEPRKPSEPSEGKDAPLAPPSQQGPTEREGDADGGATAQLPPQLREALKDAGFSDQDPGVKLLAAEVSASRVQIGPMPPPDILREYDEIVPGCAERIIANFERQADHRRSLEIARVEGSERRLNRGQLFAFGLALFGAVAGVGIAAYNPDIWPAGILITFATLGVPGIATLVRGWLSRSD